VDIKLALCRFIAELLIRLPASNLKNTPTSYYLDEIVQVPFDGQKYMERGLEDQSEIDTYGCLLLMEFGQVFKALYIDMRDARQMQTHMPREHGEHENSKIDISMCLSLLIASCQSAKAQTVSQNLLKKVIEICSENISAVHMNELQKYQQKPQDKSR